VQIKLLEIFDINRIRIYSTCKQLDFNLFYVPLRRKTTFTPKQRQPQNSQTHFNVKNNMYKVVVRLTTIRKTYTHTKKNGDSTTF